MAEPVAPPPFPEAPSREMAHPAPLAPGGDPVGGTHGDVGGSRHYTGAGLGPLTAWKCPACGQENSGALDVGCSHCGSGSARPRHVGLPPPRAGKGPNRIGEGIWQEEKRTIASVPNLPDPDVLAFVHWTRQHDFTEQLSLEGLEAVLYEAWKAAITWYRTSTQVNQPDEPTTQSTDEPDRVRVPRFLLGQVITILETTYDLPDEQQSPELLSLVAQLREILE